MRTAVVRVNVDPAGELTAGRIADGLVELRSCAAAADVELMPDDPVAMPAHAREVRLLLEADEPGTARETALRMCSTAFGTDAAPGNVTFVSRGTDDDVHGVLAGFGVLGHVGRKLDDEGFDVVYVTVAEADLARVSESRLHTALEASLNCEVHIHTA